MYKYFVPDEPDDGEQIRYVSDKVPSGSVKSRDDIVPLYDEGGKFSIATFILLLLQPILF